MHNRFLVGCTFPQFERQFNYCVGERCLHWFLEEMLEFADEALKFYYNDKRTQKQYLVDWWFVTE